MFSYFLFSNHPAFSVYRFFFLACIVSKNNGKLSIFYRKSVCLFCVMMSKGSIFVGWTS